MFCPARNHYNVCVCPDGHCPHHLDYGRYAGKDRTGLLAMLLLTVAGASDEQIIEDYFRSDENGQTALGNIADRTDLKKLDVGTFSRAPREVMEGTLAFIRCAVATSSASFSLQVCT